MLEIIEGEVHGERFMKMGAGMGVTMTTDYTKNSTQFSLLITANM